MAVLGVTGHGLLAPVTGVQGPLGLAAETKVPLVPFILEGFALDPQYMQADGIHPNAAGQPKVLENVWPSLSRLLER